MPETIIAIALWIGAQAAEAASIAGLSAATATVVGDIVAATVFIGITVGGAFALQAFAPTTPKQESMRETLRQTIPPRRRGCGTARLGGPFLHDQSNVGILYRVIAFCDRPCEQIIAYLLNQDEVFVAGGYVQALSNGAYRNNHVQIYTTLGVSGTNAFPQLTGEMPASWPANCYGTGIFMGYMRCIRPDLTNYTIVFPRGKPQFNLIAKIGPSFDWRDSSQSQTNPATWKVTANPVVNLVHELWAYRDYDWAADFAPSLAILTDEANRCDAPIGVLNILAKIILDAPVAQNYVAIRAGPVPPVGVAFYLAGQTFTVQSTAAGGVGGGSGTGTYVYFATGQTLAASVAIGSVARWQSDATHPVTEPTYACGGVWNADEQESDTVTRFLASMDGWMARRGSDGAVVIRCGHYYEPTVVIGADEVIAYTWQPFNERGKAINQITPSFMSPAHDYTQIDTTPMQDDADVGVNGLSTQSFQPEMVQSNGQVRRLAKRRLNKVMQHVEQFTLKASGIRCLGERYIRVQMPGELEDLADTVLEIVGDPEISANGMAVTLQVAPADPDIDSWDAATDEGPGPVDSAGPAQSGLAQPTIVSISTLTATGATGARLRIVAAPPASLASRIDLSWFTQWRVQGDQTFVQNRYDNLPAGNVTLDTGFVNSGVILEVEVAYQTGAGSLSPWSAIQQTTATPGGTLTATATQAIPAGAFVNVVGTSMSLATAANPGAKSANGYVLTAVANGAQGTVYVSGLNSSIAVAASAPTVWLSNTTPGGFVTAAPTGGAMVQTLGSAVQGQGVTFAPGVPA
jgi:hypothetical protein